MRITLRRASALQNRIAEVLKEQTVKTTVSVSEFENAQERLDQARTHALTTDRDRYDLVRAQYRIRGLVGEANARAGVDSRLTDIARIDRRVAQLNELTKDANERENFAVLEGQLQRRREAKADDRMSMYYSERRGGVETGVFTTEDLADFRREVAQLKLDRQRLNDEILELNVRTEIELDGDAEATLRRFNLV